MRPRRKMVGTKVHKGVWKIATKNLKNYFYDDLRKKRVEFDYALLEHPDDTAIASTEEVARAAPKAFGDLFAESKANIEAAYDMCSSRAPTCVLCVRSKRVSCAKDEALQKLEDLRLDAEALLRDTLPIRLSEVARRQDLEPLNSRKHG